MLEGFALCQTRKVRDASILKYSVVSWASCDFQFNICGVFVLVALSAFKFLTWCRPCSRSYEWAGHMDRRQKYQRTALGQTFKICDTLSSIKHDLARSCFQLWPKIGNEGDKISRKQTGKALAETVFSRNSKYQASKYQASKYQYVASKYRYLGSKYRYLASKYR